MKTTLIIPDPIFQDVKRRAGERGTTLSGLVTELLVIGLRTEAKPRRRRLPPLPVFKTGRAKVNIADRDALYDAMERD